VTGDSRTTKFTWNDIVTAKAGAPPETRPGERAWVVGILTEAARYGSLLEQFPTGIVYDIEFEDGSSVSVHEGTLDAFEVTADRPQRP